MRCFSVTHKELMAEISIGAGIQPISAIKKPKPASVQGVGSIKSGFICMPRDMATAAAATVAMVRLTMMILETLSNAL